MSDFFFHPRSKGSLKVDMLGKWIESTWLAQQPEDSHHHIIWTANACVNLEVLKRFDQNDPLEDDYRFEGATPYTGSPVARVVQESYLAHLTHQSGAYLYRFSNGVQVVQVMVAAAFTTDDGFMDDIVTLAAVPDDFVVVWSAFAKECNRISRSITPDKRVYVIGGRESSFEANIDWEDVILPPELKTSIFSDVSLFFEKGISIYKRLKLKPFRKLLLAGVPGTGKTMLCAALAKWALDQNYLVIYISSADKDGPTFRKIQYALDVASQTESPTLIILEELDAYLHEEEKALVLNVLDGSESAINEQGTLIIATTNYPEAIDERVLKRPGRLDRIFIIPEMNRAEDTEKMLRMYLGDMWQDAHASLAERLVGYPGAFVREVAIYALTQVAEGDLEQLSLELLESSYDKLSKQINLRDDFLNRQAGLGYRGLRHRLD